jgi:putative ABC transport system permease protein
MSNDLRYALRSLLKNPGPAVVALITLALGVGANTAIFSVANGVLLRPLPYPDAASIVQVSPTSPDDSRGNHSPADFLDLQRENRTLLKMAGYREEPITVSVNGREPVPIRGAMVTADYFDVFGVRPIAGRTFDGGALATEPLVVVSETAWTRYLSSDPSVVGRLILINGIAHTVVGIMPSSFDYPLGSHIWMLSPRLVPTPPVGLRGDLLANRDARYFSSVARLQPGVTLAQAQADLSALAEDLAERFPQSHARRGLAVQRLHERIVGDVRRAILLLLGAVGVVLVIACANIASLLLARASGRQREFALRAALGAGRARLMRQLLAESLLLGAAGGMLGVLAGGWAIGLLRNLLPSDTPRVDEIGLDVTVMTATMSIALLSAVLFGLAPALQLSRTNAASVLREGDRGSSAGRRRARTRAALVVSEMALTLILLVTAGLLTNSFLRLQRVDLGFNVDQVTLVGVALPQATYPTGLQQAAFYRAVLDGLEARPDIQSAAIVFPSPLDRSQASSTFNVEGLETLRDQPFASFASISPDYFRTLGIPLLSGRLFTNRDRDPAPAVTIVNAAFARRYWPAEDAIGKRVRFDEKDAAWMTVVGVVGDSRNLRLDQTPAPLLYIPIHQFPLPFMSIVARSAAGTGRVVSAVLGAVHAVDPELPIGRVRPLSDVVSASVAQPRFRMTLVMVFAAMALVLAAVGVYGLISYGVALRMREIGIRVALGAQPRQLLLPIIREGLMLALAGIAFGAIGSLAATRLLSGLLFEVEVTDPATFIAAAFALLGSALVASYIPSRRSLHVDPLIALRAE